jgi:hypothetical protein
VQSWPAAALGAAEPPKGVAGPEVVTAPKGEETLVAGEGEVDCCYHCTSAGRLPTAKIRSQESSRSPQGSLGCCQDPEPGELKVAAGERGARSASVGSAVGVGGSAVGVGVGSSGSERAASAAARVSERVFVRDRESERRRWGDEKLGREILEGVCAKY